MGKPDLHGSVLALDAMTGKAIWRCWDQQKMGGETPWKITKTQRTQTFWEPLGKTIFKGNPKSLNFFFLVIWWGKECYNAPYTTPSEINMEPEHDGLEDDFPFPRVYSQVPC